MEVILRAEAVEQAQAGDKCDFTGSLIVVPDVAQISTPGKMPALHKGTQNSMETQMKQKRNRGNWRGIWGIICLTFKACKTT